MRIRGRDVKPLTVTAAGVRGEGRNGKQEAGQTPFSSHLLSKCESGENFSLFIGTLIFFGGGLSDQLISRML